MAAESTRLSHLPDSSDPMPHASMFRQLLSASPLLMACLLPFLDAVAAPASIDAKALLEPSAGAASTLDAVRYRAEPWRTRADRPQEREAADVLLASPHGKAGMPISRPVRVR